MVGSRVREGPEVGGRGARGEEVNGRWHKREAGAGLEREEIGKARLGWGAEVV